MKKTQIKKKQLKLLLIALFLSYGLLHTITFLPNINNNLDDKPDIQLKTSATYTDIEINDLPGSLTNWSWVETQPWFGGGLGTSGAPYVIESHNFEYSAGGGHSFAISNSRKHFIVRNCTFINSDSGYAGLYLNNVTNGQIVENEIYNNYYGIRALDTNYTSINENVVQDNADDGIHLYDNYYNNIHQNYITRCGDGLELDNCQFNNIYDNDIYENLFEGLEFNTCHFNTINENEINLNEDFGFELDDSENNTIYDNIIRSSTEDGINLDVDSNYNLFYKNYFINNSGVNAYDLGTGNNWNNSLIGNYWDNYIGYDMNLDGIGDFPYGIIGSAGNYDYLPIWNRQASIAIDDLPTSLTNWSWAETQPWFGGGSGTELDPYVLQDFNIESGGGTGNCLSIENSRKHFIVKECSLSNSGTSTTNAGIYLSNVTNALIIDNDCTNNYNGIYFESSHNNDFSSNDVINSGYVGIWGENANENNTIYDNFIFNGDWGIAIENGDNNIIQHNIVRNIPIFDGILLYGSGNNCLIDNNDVNTCNVGIRVESFSNSIISHNTITNSTGYGLNLNDADNSLVFENYFIINGNNAIDNGVNNDWNNTMIGNYWDDYTGYDMNFDGIGDDPYSIAGGAVNFDYLPIWDLQGPIAIDDLPGSLNNWTWAASQPWCSGSGTELDPYIIKDLIIDGNGTDNCIMVLNSNKHFIIRDCKVYNSGTVIFASGILLSNVTNSQLIGNNASNNEFYGITILDSDYNTISGNIVNHNTDYGMYINDSNNNTISENIGMYNRFGLYARYSYENTFSHNIFNNNTDLGLAVEFADNNKILENTVNFNTGMWGGIVVSQSVDTLVHGNTIIGNNPSGIGIIFGADRVNATRNIIKENAHGIDILAGSENNLIYENIFLENDIHAFDDGSNNDWNFTTIGNYWDNHTGPDTSPNDGIVDTPYTFIAGSAGSMDYLPIAEDGPPLVVINNPSEFDIFGAVSPSFNVTITDNFLNETWYNVQGVAIEFLDNIFIGSTGTIEQSIWDGLPEGMLVLSFLASDYAGHIGEASINIEKDSQAPIIVINSPITGEIFGASAPSFVVEISDDNLDSMWYSLDGGTTNFVFTTNGTINQAAWSALAEGSVTIMFYANDTLGNLESESVDVVKSLPPPDDNFFVIIIIVISIVAGVAVVSVVLLLRRRKAGV